MKHLLVRLVLVACLFTLITGNSLARYYDARTGRFLSVDPLVNKTPGLSSYHYSFNNPLSYKDPNGQHPIIFYVAAAAVLTALRPEPANAPGPKDQAFPPRQGPLEAVAFVADATMVTGAMRAVGAMAAGLAEPSASQGLTTIASGVGKAEAKRALVEQSQGIAEGQLKEVMGQIGKATSKESVTVEKLTDGTMRVLKERAGKDGKQVIESLINPEGKMNIVQRAYDSAGKLVHEDPKLLQLK